MAEEVCFFVSYAHRDGAMADKFLRDLEPHLGSSERFQYRLWQDKGILTGETWRREIDEALDHCSFGLLLVSPAFLASEFIRDHELPRFVGDDAKPALPVMLKPINFERQDLKGLGRQQIFGLSRPAWSQAKPYAECQGTDREHFVAELFDDIDRRVEKVLQSRSA